MTKREFVKANRGMGLNEDVIGQLYDYVYVLFISFFPASRLDGPYFDFSYFFSSFIRYIYGHIAEPKHVRDPKHAFARLLR